MIRIRQTGFIRTGVLRWIPDAMVSESFDCDGVTSSKAPSG